MRSKLMMDRKVIFKAIWCYNLYMRSPYFLPGHCEYRFAMNPKELRSSRNAKLTIYLEVFSLGSLIMVDSLKLWNMDKYWTTPAGIRYSIVDRHNSILIAKFPS